MTLSGWTRLWIVGAVIWWAAGAWWLYENFRPDTVLVKPAVYAQPPPPPPPIDANKMFADALRRSLEPPPRPPTREETEALIEKLESEPPISSRQMRASLFPLEPAVTREDWTAWLIALGVVIGAPFVFAAAFAGVLATSRWVWRGFRPKT